MDQASYESLRAKVMKMINKSRQTRKVNTEQRTKVFAEFSSTRRTYDNALENKELPDYINEKYSLSYLFLGEQFNQKIFKYDYYLKRCDQYEERLEHILRYLASKNSNKEIETHNRLYAINSTITKEAGLYYDSLKEKYVQKRRLNSKFISYVSYLESINDSDYDKYKELVPSAEVVNTIDIELEKVEKEKNILFEILKEQKFVKQYENILLLTNPDIREVLFVMYPSFKEKIVENSKIVNLIDIKQQLMNNSEPVNLDDTKEGKKQVA